MASPDTFFTFFDGDGGAPAPVNPPLPHTPAKENYGLIRRPYPDTHPGSGVAIRITSKI